ncbi:MAG: ABC transporter [Alphaproteobacteria bacterium TMED87]|nr:ABC transporter [Rhodospirillaceae bacterium]OUV09597.1 MAG: ABC transporter [Alphaproteobacteria bacterium TMED87]
MTNNILKIDSVHRSFKQGDKSLNILKGINLSLKPGELVALLGPSGSGKSTLLHLAGLLEKPDSGEIIIDGKSSHLFSEKKISSLRSKYFGFVYQYHHLLYEFSAVENIMIPQIIAGVGPSQARIRSKELLSKVNLIDRQNHRPGVLSGGEQQRVAIIRALANNPKVLLADEPTGNLDPNTADVVFNELLYFSRENNLAGLVATHNIELAKRMDRMFILNDGRLFENHE